MWNLKTIWENAEKLNLNGLNIFVCHAICVILYVKMHNVLKCCTEHKMDAAELNPQMLIIKALWDKRLISTQTSDVHPVKFVSSRGQQIRSAHTGIIKAHNAQKHWTCIKRTKLYKNTHNKTVLKIKEGNHPWSTSVGLVRWSAGAADTCTGE